MNLARFFLAGALALAFLAPLQAGQWCVGAVCTNGLVIEDGAGNKFGSANPLAVQDSTVANAIAAAALTPPIQMKAQSVVVTDLASQAITTTGNGSTLALDGGNSLASVVNVTAASGTNPTLDLTLQESQDAGATWNDIYQLQRITATGAVTVPNMLLTGTRRWKWTVGGTSPSFTLSIVTTRGTASAPLIRQFFDRTVDPNTLGSASPAWSIGGCRNNQLFVFNGAVTTTAAVWQIQYSPDKANYTNAGSTVNPGNNSTAQSSTTTSWPYARIGVATAGSGDTLNYVSFYCTN
ncbi:hypothetical protein [Rhodoblastus sp.]|jgi:hypothetical protein|uniref:hypothetical protein n=1 Tax=Rhodoblastus sp. TaxID=1962975 RepID=UPI0025DABC0A|nr:hypothetical protein [Rhodoblastus sp.]